MASQSYMYKGDNKKYRVRVIDDAGDPQDITGGGLIFTVKEDPTDAAPTIQKDSSVVGEIDITDPSGGIAFIYIVPEDTRDPGNNVDVIPGTYEYDIQYTNASGEIKTLCKGTLKIMQDVTT